MNILVIGNGFDLEHGLPTKYKDFLDFMQGINILSNNKNVITDEYFSEQLEKKVKHSIDDNVKKYFYDKNLLNFTIFNKWSGEENSKELVEYAGNNIWIKHFINNMNYEKEGWIDLESEISNVIQCFNYMKNISTYYDIAGKLPDNTNYNKKEIVRKIIEYSVIDINSYQLIDKNLESVIKVLNEHLTNLIRCLEIYLEDCVAKIDVNYTAPDIEEKHFDKVLSFNYTNTYERVYFHNNDEIEYDYIHGKADITRIATENNMVLGIDEYLDEGVKDQELEFIAFKKYFQRIYKRTGNIYKKWIPVMDKLVNYKFYSKEGSMLEFSNEETDDFLKKAWDSQKYNSINHIYIFGHSLDITDKDIIKEIIECSNTETTIFYYDKGVYAQQIANMVKIIGQDELIKRVSGAEPTIIFKQQNQRIKRD